MSIVITDAKGNLYDATGNLTVTPHTAPAPTPTAPCLVWWDSKAAQTGVLNTDVGLAWINGLQKIDNTAGYIELAPPYSGIGVLRVKTSALVTLENQGTTVAKVRLGLGVDNPNGSNKPIFPYLGVSHAASDAATQFWTLAAGEARQFTLWRLDIVDNALQSDQPIVGWPDWSVAMGTGKKVMPTISLCGNNDTPTNKVIYRDVQMRLEAF